MANFKFENVGVAFHSKSRLNAGEGECERTSCGINKFWSSGLLLRHIVHSVARRRFIWMDNLESQSKTILRSRMIWEISGERCVRKDHKDVSWLLWSWATSAVQMGFSPTRDQAPEPLTLTARISSTSDIFIRCSAAVIHGTLYCHVLLPNLNEFKQRAVVFLSVVASGCWSVCTPFHEERRLT